MVPMARAATVIAAAEKPRAVQVAFEDEPVFTGELLKGG